MFFKRDIHNIVKSWNHPNDLELDMVIWKDNQVK